MGATEKVRHIPFPAALPDTPEMRKWKREADEIQAALKAAKTDEERSSIIDKYSGHWSALKEWLLSISHNKCWYSDTRADFHHFHVEHYRPKKKSSATTEEGGYWWLAFDWKNYRICGDVGNTKKGSSFPLADLAQKCKPWKSLRFEKPLFLDPIDLEDVELIFFMPDGSIEPRPGSSPYDQKRVQESYKRYRLDFPRLEESRKTKWATCHETCQKYLTSLRERAEDSSDDAAKARGIAALDKLRELVNPQSDLSSVALAYIEYSNDENLKKALIRILRSL